MYKNNKKVWYKKMFGWKVINKSCEKSRCVLGFIPRGGVEIPLAELQ